MKNPILWIHGEAVGPNNPALAAHPGRPAVFVLDTELIVASGLSLKRLGFLYECLLELPVTIRRGDVGGEVVAFAERHRADGVITTAAVDPRFAAIHQSIAAVLPMEVLPTAPLVELNGGGASTAPKHAKLDLQRFSRYWKRAEAQIWKLWEEGDASTITRPG